MNIPLVSPPGPEQSAALVRQEAERQVLVFAPTRNDSGLTADFLRSAGMQAVPCDSMEEVCRRAQPACGVIIVAEEALTPTARECLLRMLAVQEPWSDLPIIVITSGGEDAHLRFHQLGAAAPAGNFMLLERPFRPETLVRSVEAALRARQRQYEGRDLLGEQRATRERLQQILESISDAFAVLDREWRFTYVNRSYAELFCPDSPSPKNMLGKPIWDCFPDLAGTDLEQFYRRVMREQRSSTIEVHYARIDRWIEVRAHPTAESLSLYVADVTERRRAERALRESEARYRTLMERASEGIFVSDPQGRHVMVNPAGCEMLGFDLDEILQLRARELYALDDATLVQSEIERMREGDVLHHDRKMRRKDGTFVHIEASVTKLTNGLIQCVARDVTARKRAEEEQRRRSERAQLLSETLGLLLGAGDPEVIVRELFPKVAAQLGVEIYLNFMVDEPGQSLRLHAYGGLDEATAESLGHLEFGQAICGCVAEMRRPVIANAIQDSEDPRAHLVRGLGIQAYVCNPLIAGDRLLGTLSFGSRKRQAFDNDEIEFLGVVAQYSAVALDRLRTTRELKARTRTLEVLNRIGALLSGELDPDRLVQAVTDAGREVTQAAFGAFFYNVTNPQGESYMLYTLSGAPKSAFEGFKMPRNTPLFGATFRGEGVVRIADVQEDKRYGRMGPHFGMPKGHLDVRSYLAAPVISRSGEVLGGLFFGHPEPNVFTEEAEHILAGIAAQAAIAMDNARLYESVQKTADRLSLSISSANLGDFTWDAKTDRIILSPRTAEIYGVSHEANHTRSEMRKLLHEADQSRSKAALERSIAEKIEYDIEYRVNRPDGSQRWVAAKGRPYYAADGKIAGMVGVVQDITAHKHAEMVSEAKRKVLHLLAEGAPLESVLAELVRSVELEAERRMKGSIVLVDDDGVHLRHGAGPSLPAAIIQASNDIVIGPSSGAWGVAAFTRQPVYVPDIATDPIFAAHRGLALSHGLRCCWSMPIFSSDGEVLAVFSIYYPEPRELRPEDTSIVETATRTAAVAIQRRRSERALRESEARQRQLLAGLPVACYTMDQDGRLTFFNDAAARLWGRVPEFERDLWAGAFGTSADNGKRFMLDEGPGATALKERRSVRGLEGFILRPDGSRRWVVPHPDPLFDAAGNCIGVINVIVDVTEERHAKRLLQEAKETAEAASAAKDRFLAVLSHELRTPLTPVLMTVASLEHDDGVPEIVREDMAMIRRNVELETKLIDDLLDLSRITTGKLRLRLQTVDLHEAVRQVCGICRPQIQEKGILLNCELGDAQALVSADPARLQQVLWNVIKNAAKFTPHGGEIRVSTRVDGARHVVEVRDTGIGIAAETLPRVFDAFEQGEGVTRQFGGLGLGLAISKAIVEMHGGTIKVASEGRNKGATFTISIPTLAEFPEPQQTQQKDDGKWEPGNLRLLVVEDHADTAQTLVRILRTAGFSVVIANNVESALKLAANQPFDILLSDIGLPDGTGYDLLRGVKKMRPVQAIAMSGFGMDEDLRKSREAGFSEHLVKPVHVPELMEAIRRIRA